MLASLQGQIFVTGKFETSKLHFVAYIELYRYPSLAGQTLFPRVGGRGRKCGGEKGSGVSGPYSVASAGM